MFKEINACELGENIIKKISQEWMLITAGNENAYNMMTASWGFMGEMWGKNTVIAVIRPQRYTMEFVEKEEYFSLSFYGDNKSIHSVCGSKSGRDVNKTELTGLTPVFDKAPYFNEANTVIVCKKQYVQKMEKNCFVDTLPDQKWYPNEDYHYMVFGKIEKVLVKEN
ncbi:MAG: flavin reductase family protein [Ruminococcaceae bacterium]|nr:flavin reductase family protein [Oscillospiraceae bacterium]